jgi:ribose-phosphate pyrophosphokinase
MSIVSVTIFNKEDSIIITDTNFFKFSGGEVHVQLKDLPKHTISTALIKTRIKSSDDIMELLMVTNSLKSTYGSKLPIDLVLPYLPYSRQDKISDDGESLSLKVFAELINSQEYNSVSTLDVHSDTAKALFDNFNNFEQNTIIKSFEETMDIDLLKDVVLVSPDFGASKKIYKLASEYGLTVVQSNKERDSNGHIIRTEVYRDDFNGKDVLIVDDICDGGRTFQEIAKVLKQRNVGKISLYVTHGIFSKGVDILFEDCIDKIYTTNSFIEESTDERVIVLDVLGE